MGIDIIDIEEGVMMIGRIDEITDLLEKAIAAGYGELPMHLCMKLYLSRN
ncbi:hypothetical protein LCGC14_0408810 [marine sediment metagenome]|uniref:Uncharacterized protein n=1 Tax=marine sediment metagenome TaxID=412755 RepID=A0A0F9T070_9ZZZZ